MTAPEQDTELRAHTGDDAPLLFCPFCRECYEGETVCPVHELLLVDFIDLPKQAHERANVRWDDPVAPWEPRFGRAWIALGAVLLLVGFFLPFAIGSYDDRVTIWSGLDMANGRAPNLWSLPFAAALFVVFLYRRMTPLAMRGARLAAVLLAITPVVSLLYSMRNILRGVEQAHGAIGLSWGVGVWVIGAASVVLLIGAFRFGAMPPSAELPHGSAPDEAEAAGGIETGRPRRRRGRRR